MNNFWIRTNEFLTRSLYGVKYLYIAIFMVVVGVYWYLKERKRGF